MEYPHIPSTDKFFFPKQDSTDCRIETMFPHYCRLVLFSVLSYFANLPPKPRPWIIPYILFNHFLCRVFLLLCLRMMCTYSTYYWCTHSPFTHAFTSPEGIVQTIRITDRSELVHTLGLNVKTLFCIWTQTVCGQISVRSAL